jgi:SNF2 family DNA or RNA helicase
MPFRFMGPDTVPYASFEEFRRKYFFPVDPDQYIWKEIGGARLEIRKIINDVSVFFAKEECINLPEIIYQRYSCNIEGEQKKVYEDMRANLIAEIENMCDKCDKKGKCDKSCDKTISTKNALTVLTKLQQIACGFYMNTTIRVKDDGSEETVRNIIDFKENAKLRLLIDVLGNIPEDRKVIIWSNFVHSIDIIELAIQRAGYGESLKIYQNVDAYDQVEKFKDPKYRYLIANPSKASAGLNIQFGTSNYQVHYSCNFSYIQREQAEGRQYREGQKNAVTVIDVSCSKTIDDYVLACLVEKEEMSDDLMSLARVKKALLISPNQEDREDLSIEQTPD